MKTEQGQSPVGTPRQLLTYDETPTGRPLPTLREIRQANLRRILEEEGADTPCDICGAPIMIIEIVQGEGILNHKTLRGIRKCRSLYIVAGASNMDIFSANCLARYYDDSMTARFPPKGRKVQKPLRQYDCRRCGQRHPFNVYWPICYSTTSNTGGV